MPGQEIEYDVFLSYTEANKAEAQNLYERLRNEAIRVFFAVATIFGGGKSKPANACKCWKAI
jgi:hypothetical protein